MSGFLKHWNIIGRVCPIHGFTERKTVGNEQINKCMDGKGVYFQHSFLYNSVEPTMSPL